MFSMFHDQDFSPRICSRCELYSAYLYLSLNRKTGATQFVCKECAEEISGHKKEIDSFVEVY